MIASPQPPDPGSGGKAALLAGRTILVTRPRHQAGPLARAIEAAGGRALVVPLLEILPVEDPATLQAMLASLAGYDFVVFVSANAVAFGLPAIRAAGPWPQGLRAAAVGAATARALHDDGVAEVIVPATQFDSEALLALPELAPAAVRERRVLILRGNGGRELLADTLRGRGAGVECVTCYRRLPPGEDAGRLGELLAGDGVDAIVVSSGESLGHLVDILDDAGRARLAHTPIFAPHPRIAERAQALGLFAVATGPADAGLLDGLCAYNWPLRPTAAR